MAVASFAMSGALVGGTLCFTRASRQWSKLRQQGEVNADGINFETGARRNA